MSQLASQEHIDRLRDAGRSIIDSFREIVATSYPDGLDEQDLDVALGRELAMALFLAATGDELISRYLMIRGIGMAIGECVAQQGSADGGQGIVNSLQDGVRAGVSFVNEGFARAGRA